MGQNIINIQQNFSNGTVTSKASGRTDIDQFRNSVKSSVNMLTTKYGSITSRAGFKYLGAAKTNTEHLLLPFKYSDNIGYCLEFAQNNIRFWRNKALVTDSAPFTDPTFTSGISDWSSISTGTGAISHSSGKLKLTGAGAGNEARARFTFPYCGTNLYTCTVDVATNTVTYKVGTTSGGTEIATGSLTTGTAKTFTFTPATNGTIYITFEFAGTGDVDLDNISITSTEYLVAHPYAVADLKDLHITQSFDVMYIVHKNYAPRKLVRYGNDNWALETVTLKDGAYLDQNTTTTTVTPAAVSGSGVNLTFSSTTGINNNLGFNAGDVGRLVRIKSGEDASDRVTYAGDGTRTTFPITFSFSTSADIEVYLQASTGAWTLKALTTDYTVNSSGQVVMGTAPASGEALIIQRKNTGTGRWGYATITAVTNSTTVVVTINDSWHGTNATTMWRLGAFYTSNYPSSVKIADQRLHLADKFGRIYSSQLGDYENFQPDTADRKGVPSDATAIYIQVAATEGNESQALTAQQGLVLLTSGELVSLIPQLGTAASSINLPSVSKNSETSASNIMPLLIGRDIIYMDYFKSALNIASFDYNLFGYKVIEVSTFAENLLRESPIKQITYQPLPNKTLWMVRNDGNLLSLTLIPEMGVVAFNKHTVAGTSAQVISATCVQSGQDNDHLYILVKRTIDGGTKYYIEAMDDLFDGDSLATGCNFLDAAYSYSGTAISTVTGLSHLEGQTVRIITTEGVHPNKTVSSGQITLDYTSTDIKVGLYSNRHVETHPLQVEMKHGTGRASKKSLYEVHVEFYETASAKVGLNADRLKELIFTEPSGTGTNNLYLYTGLKNIKLASPYDETIQVRIEQQDPLPLTINSIIAKFDIVGK